MPSGLLCWEGKTGFSTKALKGLKVPVGCTRSLRTARRNGFELLEYLRSLFERCLPAKTSEDWEKLIPWNILPLNLTDTFVRSLRQECLDHFVIFTEKQLRNILQSYVDYYNNYRPHQGLCDIPNAPPPGNPPASGAIKQKPMVFGLHNHYYRERHNGIPACSNFLISENSEGMSAVLEIWPFLSCLRPTPNPRRLFSCRSTLSRLFFTAFLN
jgi:hypothetical protein